VQVPAPDPADGGKTGPQVGGEPLDHPSSTNPAPPDLYLHRLQQRHVIGGLQPGGGCV